MTSSGEGHESERTDILKNSHTVNILEQHRIDMTQLIKANNTNLILDAYELPAK